MNHPSEHLLVLYIGGELSQAERAVVDDHLALCDACSSALRTLAEMDEVLRALPAMPVPPELGARVRARLLVADGAPRSWWTTAAAACVLLAAGTGGGWLLARSTIAGSPAPIVRNAEGSKFALIFAEEPNTSANVPESERQRDYNEFMEWMHAIGDSSVRLGGTELAADRGRIVGASASAFDPALELSGFIVIRAAGYEEAERHARRCPIVARGGQVIVKQLRN